MSDLTNYWAAANYARSYVGQDVKKPFVFLLSRPWADMVDGKSRFHHVIVFLTQIEFEDHQRMRDVVMATEFEKLGWDPDRCAWQEVLTLRPAGVQRLREVLQTPSSTEVILRYPHFQHMDGYAVVNVDGVAWRYKSTSHGVICAPSHLKREMTQARAEHSASRTAAA